MFNVKEEDFEAYAKECKGYAKNAAGSLEGVRYDKGLYALSFLISFVLSTHCETKEKAIGAVDLIASLIKSMINDAEENNCTYWKGYRTEEQTSH